MVRLDDLMHRRLILETLKERDDHPTAEQIYFYVRAQADSVSRAAVYRSDFSRFFRKADIWDPLQKRYFNADL